jgi:spore germination protein KC
LLLCAVLSGCNGNFLPASNELDQFEIVRVVGIDKSATDSSLVEVTFIMQTKTQSSGKGSSGSNIVTILSSTGPTVFDAARKLKASCDKIIYFGQVDYFLIGEEAAREDFSKYYDLIQRGPEVRLSTKIYLIRDNSAKEFLEATSSGEKFIADRLEGIQTDVDLLSNTNEVTAIDVTSMLDQSMAATVIPALRCEKAENKKSTGQLPEKDIQIGGYAVIRDFKLVGFLDEEIARGYNFLTNRVNSCPVNVTDSTGAYVSLEVIRSNTEVFARFDGDTLAEVTYRIHAFSNIEEQHSRADIYNNRELEELADKQSAVLRDAMVRIIEASKEYQIDCTGLGQAISLRHPFRWDKLRDSWVQIYPGLNINVKVESEISRSYDIVEPNGSEKER